jgi:hypothetical protein
MESCSAKYEKIMLLIFNTYHQTICIKPIVKNFHCTIYSFVLKPFHLKPVLNISVDRK